MFPLYTVASKVSEKPILSYERLLTKQSKDGGYVNSIVDKTKMLQGQSLGEIKNQLKTLKEQTLGTDKHPYLSPDVYAEYESVLSVVENQLTDFSTKTADFQTRIQKEIEKKITELQSDLLPDNVNNAIESSFQIGKEYSFSKMMEIAREGSFRYSEEIPPGYEDGKEKTGLQKYGDLFVWNQILDCAKSKQKDFIFVTNDVKIDWYEEDKRTPRFELLKEFREQENKRIWLLSMKNFIYHVNLLLDDQIHENVLQDIDSVQDEKENDKIRKELSADDIQKIFNNLIVKPIYVIDKIPKNESIRLFDNPDIYEAEDENGRKFRIITTIVGGGNYARVLVYFSFSRISSALIPLANILLTTLSASAFFASSAALASALAFLASSLAISFSTCLISALCGFSDSRIDLMSVFNSSI